MANAGIVAAGVFFLLLGLLLLVLGYSSLWASILFVVGVVLIVAGFTRARRSRLTAI